MIQAFPYFLRFKKPFKIASVERIGTDNLYLRFEKDGFIGWGEAVFPPYIPERQEMAMNRINDLKWTFDSEQDLFNVIQENQILLKKEPALACAMETVLISWLAHSKDLTINEVLCLPKDKKDTSYTIGIGSNEEIINSINAYPEATYFKLKVNENEIERIIQCFQANSRLPFVVDANQGFTNYSNAKYWADKLWDMGVDYFEQPFHKDDIDSHHILSKEADIPIIADESFQRIEDFSKIKEAFDGINVKIIKSGGLLEAKKVLEAAKVLGMTTILGCMSGSFVSINNARALANLADYIDLDGPMLISNNPDLNSF